MTACRSKSIISHPFLLESNTQYANELFSRLVPLINYLFLLCQNSYPLIIYSSDPPGHKLYLPRGMFFPKTLVNLGQSDAPCSIFPDLVDSTKYQYQPSSKLCLKKIIRGESPALSGNFSIQLVQC